MSRHDGVSCDACLKANFRGRRYKCLICYDYDLCASCHEARATTTRHTTEHPMQCILTQHDFEIFYGGEGVGSEQPQSLTCPFCGRLGFTELTLMEHTSAEHHDTSTEVVCPICASVPGGEPNHVTDDFNAHITFDHRGGGGGGTSMASTAPARELDDSGGGGGSSRHNTGVRRMQYPGRGGLGRAVPRRNLTFGSVGNGLFPSSRGESMDPIAELLSQLTGVRRSNVSSRQLQQQQQQQWHAHSSDMERRPSRRVGGPSSGVSSSMRTGVGGSSSSQAPASANGNPSTGAAANGNTGAGPNTSSGLLYGSVVTSGPATGAGVEQARVVVEGASAAAAAVSLTGAADAAAAAAGGPSVLSLEASHPASLAAYVRQQRQSAIVAALHAASNQTSEEVERSQHQQRQCEWELTKQNLLAAFTQGGDDLLSLTLPVQDALPPAASSSVTTSASGGGLSNTELQYTAVLVAHNKQKLCHGVTPNMAAAMYDVAQTHNDQAVSDLWRVVAAMSEVSESMASSSGPCQHRTSPAVTAAVVQHATDLLQTKYREHMKALVYNDLSRAGLGGVPGLAGLVKAYVSVSLPGNLHALLEDGVASNGAPVWPLLYYCVRAGGVREAAAAASENSSPAVVEIVGCLQQCSRSEDSRVSPEGEKRLRVSYKRSCKGMRDPFKRALYCLLGRCDVMEDHSDIITTTDDYLWLKLSLVDPSSESDGAVPATPTLGGGAAATKQQDVLSLASLQKLLYKQYGETHFNAYEQPLLYTTVLLLTGQFEAAIEFLRRSDRYLHHAVHIAASLYACGALCLPRSIAAPLLSRESDEPECCLRLNIARLVLLYTRRFESTNPNEALHYCFLLRELKSPTEGDVFTSSAVELCLSSREFDLLLGKLGEDGARAPGLLDAFNVDVVEVTEMVAQSCEKRGLHEDAVKLYDLAKNHEKVITLLNKLLAQVVHLATPSSTSVSAAGAGSDRERVLELACTIGLRYRAQGHTASQQSASTLHLLLDLATVFDLYHAQRYHDTIEVIRRLHLIALDRSEVEARVSGLVGVASEVKEVIPALLLAAITATHHIYTTSSSSPSPSTPTTVGDASTTQHLRQQARAIVTFAGMIPLRLHADVNARLVQLEALIN